MFPSLKSFLSLIAVAGAIFHASAAEPLFRSHDVIALVGGEDMVTLSEYGYLEALLARAFPGEQLRFRSLAWEGDTVFEQRRDLNFPPMEDQLTKVGATVVIAQFGKIESFAGMEKLPEFRAAYEALVVRLAGAGPTKRRVVLLAPVVSAQSLGGTTEATVAAYAQAVEKVARGQGCQFVDFAGREAQVVGQLSRSVENAGLAKRIVRLLGVPLPPDVEPVAGAPGERLRATIIEKNRLWFHYWRPQNWAFLNGDRTVQPSSRDHLDPSKRWFPDEVEQFIPLIEAKEREIDQLAAKHSEP